MTVILGGRTRTFGVVLTWTYSQATSAQLEASVGSLRAHVDAEIARLNSAIESAEKSREAEKVATGEAMAAARADAEQARGDARAALQTSKGANTSRSELEEVQQRLARTRDELCELQARKCALFLWWWC